MGVIRTVRNYFFYCGIEKDEYNAIKKDAYVSNFYVWRALHILMVIIFAFLFLSTLFNGLLESNRLFYLCALAYSMLACISFFILRKDSLAAQLIIYLSISFLFLFACFITQNKPDIPAATFIVFLLVAPMFMIDKPFFMAIELCCASAIFLIWMRAIKPHDVWQMDMVNVVIFTVIGIFLNIVANSVRIREFILRRQIDIQKDTDDLTGLNNKGALSRKINGILNDGSTKNAVMMVLDVDRFKSINDNYGHDVGDDVIGKLGRFLGKRFTDDAIVGRFGGDEFIVFIKDTCDISEAHDIASGIIEGTSDITLPDDRQRFSVSIGIALYRGLEKDYSDIFKKADTALYRSKADPGKKICFYEQDM